MVASDAIMYPSRPQVPPRAVTTSHRFTTAPPSTDTFFSLAPAKNAVWTQFSSHHDGVVQFAFVDGSVRPLAFNINPSILLQLSGMRDGTHPALD